MIAMTNLGISVDAISLQQWLKDNGVLEQCGGIAYISELQDVCQCSESVVLPVHHHREVSVRRVIAVCTQVVGRVYDYAGDVESLLGDVERDILAIRPRSQRGIWRH